MGVPDDILGVYIYRRCAKVYGCGFTLDRLPVTAIYHSEYSTHTATTLGQLAIRFQKSPRPTIPLNARELTAKTTTTHKEFGERSYNRFWNNCALVSLRARNEMYVVGIAYKVPDAADKQFQEFTSLDAAIGRVMYLVDKYAARDLAAESSRGPESK
jgi:hypothetical protein